MKKVTTYTMKGALYLESQQLVEQTKHGEVCHDFGEILKLLNREDVVLSIKHIQEEDTE